MNLYTILKNVSQTNFLSRLDRFRRGLTARKIASSKYFDREYYSSQVGIRFATGSHAVKHFLLHGEVSGFKPSPYFDPLFYRENNPDLAHLTSVYTHFLAYGVTEGRPGVLDVDGIVEDGGQEFDKRRPTVAVIVHELSETGAPILAWNIIKNIPDSWNIVCVSLVDGPLKEEFTDAVCAIVCLSDISSLCLNSSIALPVVVKHIINTFDIKYVISNSVVSQSAASVFCHHGIPVVTLIHEFASYIPLEMLVNSVIYSEHVVFSSKLTLEETEKKLGFSLENASVLPQGKSIVPRIDSDRVGADLLSFIKKESMDGKYIVIGCGHVQIRKGVDLFIAGCDIVAQILGKDKVRFVWVGNGYNPDTDYGYSLWLKDQVERSDLSDCFSFLPGLGAQHLDELYSISDAMFLSSRLDPLPNVAIDALSLGVPVVCFARATGLVEYLEDYKALRLLIAPYLDVRAAADIIVRLLQDPKWKEVVQKDISQLMTKTFTIKSYVNQIFELKNVVTERQCALLSEVETIFDSGVVEKEYLQRPHQATSLRNSIEHQVRMDWAANEGMYGGIRRPFSGFSPHIYHEVNQLSSGTSPTADWLRRGRPDGPWKRHVVDLHSVECDKSALSQRLAIHIHAHYRDQLLDIVDEIALSVCRPDVVISSSSLKSGELLPELSGRYPGKVTFVEVPNVGRDLGPMLTACAKRLINYDVVGHVHTKKSLLVSDRTLVDQWVTFVLENSIGGNERSIEKISNLFALNPRLGLCFPEDPNVVGWTENIAAAHDLLDDIGLPLKLPKAIEFPVGNMFYFRPGALAPLFNRKFTPVCFPAEPLAYDGTMLHAMERLLPLIVESQGYEWITTKIPGLTR